jgi:hypothetical protein
LQVESSDDFVPIVSLFFFCFDMDVTCFHYYSGQQVLSLTLTGNIVGCKDRSLWKQVIAGIALIFLYFKSELVRALLLEFFLLRRRLSSPNSELARKFCKPPEAARLAEACFRSSGKLAQSSLHCFQR